jgi:hypothetical protein
MNGNCAKLPSCSGLGEGCWLHKIRFVQVSAEVGAGEEVGAAVGPSWDQVTAFSKRFRPTLEPACSRSHTQCTASLPCCSLYTCAAG